MVFVSYDIGYHVVGRVEWEMSSDVSSVSESDASSGSS
jgi:hypothetical protein